MKKDNNLLDYVPRIPEKLNWTEDDEHRVTVDVENKGVFNRIAQKCFGRPAVSHIALEQFGSFIWKQIDGVHTIYDIALLVKEEFGEDAEPLFPYTAGAWICDIDTIRQRYEKGSIEIDASFFRSLIGNCCCVA